MAVTAAAVAATAAVVLTPDVVVSLMKKAKRFLDQRRIRQTDFRDNLEAVKVDLGILNDVLEAIPRTTRRNLTDGIRNWREEASRVAEDARELLTRIERKNADNDDASKRTCCLCLRRPKDLHFDNKDASDLGDLRNGLDNLTKHNQIVLRIFKESPCNSQGESM